MRCPVCENQEWENIDHLRESKQGMAMCTNCGFVSYPQKYKSEDEIREHYRKEYRPAPSVKNLYTSERKIWYHEHFLRPMIEEWKKAGVKPLIGEVGSAFGLFLSWMKEQLECEVHGTEWTTTFRRVAAHEFGINLAEDFDFKRSYDLIVSYHVLEHQLDPDVWLKRYADALNANGMIYLSTPVWFREAVNFGTSGFDLSYYWHPDHINAWSEQHLEEIIRKAGLKIILKDTVVYGNTYILSKSQGEEIPPAKVFDRKKYLDIVARIQKCWQLIQSNETALAIEAYPNCPAAWINHYELNRAKLHGNELEVAKFMQAAVNACPNTTDTLMLVGDIHRRCESYEKAYQFFEKAEKSKPNNPTMLMAMSDSLRQQALRIKEEPRRTDLLKRSIELQKQIRAVSMEVAPQAISWIYHDFAQIPMEGE